MNKKILPPNKDRSHAELGHVQKNCLYTLSQVRSIHSVLYTLTQVRSIHSVLYTKPAKTSSIGLFPNKSALRLPLV